MDQQTGTAPVASAKVEKPKAKDKAKKPEAKVTKPKAESAKDFVAKFRAGTIGRLTVDLIIAGGKSNDEILAEIKKRHKDASTTSACVAWYKSKARAAGVVK